MEFNQLRWGRVALLWTWPLLLWVAGSFVSWDFTWPSEWTELWRAIWLIVGVFPCAALTVGALVSE